MRITVVPTRSLRGLLDITDALHQALDFFSLVKNNDCTHIIWNLKDISRKSPLVIEGEPVDKRTMKPDYSVVEHDVHIVERAFKDIIAGDVWEHSFPSDKRKTITGMLHRNMNGIGKTRYDFGNGVTGIEIEQATAKRYLAMLEVSTASLQPDLFNSSARREFGSIEGNILLLGSHYNNPAIQIEERTSLREVWCQVDQTILDSINITVDAISVWKNRRVIVRGILRFDSLGKLQYLSRGQVSFVDPKTVHVEDIHDPDFTGGLSVQEYLEKLREGDLE